MPPATFRSFAALATILSLTSPPLRAQSAPDAGQLLRDANRSPAAPVVLPDTPRPRPAADTDGGPRVQVSAFRFDGVTLVPEADLQARLAEFVGKPASLADLRRAADGVAQLYAERGFLARSYLPAQELRGGEVVIAVLEGRLGGLRIEQAPGSQAIGEDQVRQAMTARQRIGEPVRAEDLQRAISLLNALPGVSANSLLEPGDRPGESRLVVVVKDEPRVVGHVQLDNAGSKASGEWRASGSASINSPSGRGDQIQLFTSKSSGSAYLSAGYSLPLGYDGWRSTVSASRLVYGYALSGSRYTGSASVAGASLSYPVLRSAAFNVTVNAGHELKDFDNAVAGVQLNDKEIALSSLTLAGDRLDRLYGGGLTQFSITLGIGQLDLAGNAGDLAADAAGPRRQGAFHKINWSLSRLQRITAADTLAIAFSGQQASRNLDAAEKFGATGVGGVRAYASSEPSADDGRLLTFEWRHQINEALTLAAYHDRARVQRDHRVNPGTLEPNRFSLAGSGFGVSWGSADSWLLRGGLAWRHGTNPSRNPVTGDDSDGTHRNPRIYVSLLKIL